MTQESHPVHRVLCVAVVALRDYAERLDIDYAACTKLWFVISKAICMYSWSAGVQHKLFLQSVAGFALSPSPAGSDLKLAAFVPALKGNSGFAGIWKVSDLGKGQDQPAPLARRSFMRVQ